MPAGTAAPPSERPGGGLVAWRCGTCDRTSFPRRDRCPWCWSEDGTEVALPEEGELHSFTTIHVGRPGVPVPYTVAYVDVGTVRLFARVQGEPRIGARGRLRPTVGPDDPPLSPSLVVDVSGEAEEVG